MKYVIWGAGKRGRWVLHFLGEDNVMAFVDSYKEGTEDFYLVKPIISFEKFKNEYRDCLLVITPLDGSGDIEEQLTAAGFYTYMKLDDCPMAVPCDEQEEYSFYLDYDKNVRYGLAEVNIFSLWLYDNMKKNGVDVCFSILQELNGELHAFLEKEYDLVSETELLEKSDRVIISGYLQSAYKHNPKCISDDDFIMRNLAYCNEDLLRYKDIHKGKRCFIIATGPSLMVEDLKKLYDNNEICISMNRIFNIFSKTDWRPNYYMIEDKEMIEDMSDEIARLQLEHKFVSTVPQSYWNNPQSKGSIPYKMLLRGFIDKMPLFSSCIEKGVFNGTTVTYLCIQLAAYMGFNEIYLLGVDFSYSSNIYDFQNHFEGCDTPQNKIRLNPVHLERTLLAYKSAKNYCDEHGIKINNATRGGKLEVFERIDFDELLKNDCWGEKNGCSGFLK